VEGARIVYTLGHSTRSLEEVLAIIKRRNVQLVVDVRRWPTSRRSPWFNRETLKASLEGLGVEYRWMGDVLGGYRRFGVDVEDTGGASCFESEGFRAYAIYLTTNPDAVKAMRILEELASQRLVLILCSERLPWRCHRKIIADWLVLKGFRVIHVIEDDREIPHRPSRCARIEGDRVYYV
jgi:uncharacterized protein (DUF488 family)